MSIKLCELGNFGDLWKLYAIFNYRIFIARKTLLTIQYEPDIISNIKDMHITLWGLPWLYVRFRSEAFKGRSVVSVRSHVGCRATHWATRLIDWLINVTFLDHEKWLIGHVFFSTPMKRDTMLTTEVQWTLGFIPIKTVPRLHPTVNKKSQRWHTQQEETSVPQKAAAVCFT